MGSGNGALVLLPVSVSLYATDSDFSTTTFLIRKNCKSILFIYKKTEVNAAGADRYFPPGQICAIISFGNGMEEMESVSVRVHNVAWGGGKV